ncbi:MAG: hypothetical protein ACK5Q5_24215 [Planctomycetaceae bacterium]
MTQIVLSPEQVQQLASAQDSVLLVDSAGQGIAYVVTGFTPTEVSAAERLADSEGPWLSTADVIARLAAAETEK